MPRTPRVRFSIKAQSGPRYLSCDYCNKGPFLSRAGLTNHTRAKHAHQPPRLRIYEAAEDAHARRLSPSDHAPFPTHFDHVREQLEEDREEAPPADEPMDVDGGAEQDARVEDPMLEWGFFPDFMEHVDAMQWDAPVPEEQIQPDEDDAHADGPEVPQPNFAGIFTRCNDQPDQQAPAEEEDNYIVRKTHLKMNGLSVSPSGNVFCLYHHQLGHAMNMGTSCLRARRLLHFRSVQLTTTLPSRIARSSRRPTSFTRIIRCPQDTSRN